MDVACRIADIYKSLRHQAGLFKERLLDHPTCSIDVVWGEMLNLEELNIEMAIAYNMLWPQFRCLAKVESDGKLLD